MQAVNPKQQIEIDKLKFEKQQLISEIHHLEYQLSVAVNTINYKNEQLSRK